MEDDDLMTAVTKELESAERQIAIEQQVGDENDQAPAAEQIHYPSEGRFRGGAQPGVRAPRVLSS